MECLKAPWRDIANDLAAIVEIKVYLVKTPFQHL